MYRGAAVGIFNSLIEDGDEYEILAPKLCLGYYTEHSASKFISPTYKNIINMVQENPSIDKTAEDIIGEMIRSKFKDKWTKVYRALLTTIYDPLEEHKYYESKNTVESNQVTYGLKIENVGNASTKETTTTTNQIESDVYGFNSINPVGASADRENTTETVVGNYDDNTSHTTQEKSGADQRDISYSYDLDKYGHETAPAKLLQKELDFRNENIFADIIYKDIDSILCLNIY